MRTTLGLVVSFLLLFCVMALIAINCTPPVSGDHAIGLALEWTLHLFGGVVASSAAVGMLLVAALHGSYQRQIVLVLPLTSGLLLISANWGLALALGMIVSIWIFKYGAPEIERSREAPVQERPHL